MKKIVKLFLVMLVAMLLVSCSQKPADDNQKTTSSSQEPVTAAVINVYTRDSSSGTREAFEGAIGLGDALTKKAVETSGNGDMATKVGSDSAAIGYVSLTTDFASNNLKPLKYNGVEPSTENVINGSYTLARPFSYTTRQAGDFDSLDKEKVIAAFIDFLNNSTEGVDAVISQGGIADNSKTKAWSELVASHPVLENDLSGITIMTGGSTSVEKTIKAALEQFQALTGVGFAMNHTGSGDGYKRTLGGEKDGPNYIDIGFASRDFKSEEDVSKALASGVYCKDAVVIVVNADNTLIDDITTEEALNIFNGTKTEFGK